MNRQEANQKLVDILQQLVVTYPDQRFSQILQNYGFVFNMGATSTIDGAILNSWYNEFYVESNIILERTTEYVKNLKT